MSLAAMAYYLVGNCGRGWGMASTESFPAGAQSYELILLCSTCSRPVARLSAQCADPLLRRFNALFVMLIKQGSFSGAGNPHGLR